MGFYPNTPTTTRLPGAPGLTRASCRTRVPGRRCRSHRRFGWKRATRSGGPEIERRAARRAFRTPHRDGAHDAIGGACKARRERTRSAGHRTCGFCRALLRPLWPSPHPKQVHEFATGATDSDLEQALSSALPPSRLCNVIGYRVLPTAAYRRNSINTILGGPPGRLRLHSGGPYKM
jgi:hypothetical protein